MTPSEGRLPRGDTKLRSGRLVGPVVGEGLGSVSVRREELE